MLKSKPYLNNRTDLNHVSSLSTIEREIVDGTPYTTFLVADEQNGFTVTFFIDPVTSLIEDVYAVGQKEGFNNMSMKTDVVHTAPPALSAQRYFTFTPPDGEQLSETPISIAPF